MFGVDFQRKAIYMFLSVWGCCATLFVLSAEGSKRPAIRRVGVFSTYKRISIPLNPAIGKG